MYLIILPLFVFAQTIIEKALNSEQCQANCLSCKNGKFECLQCKEGYFLYTLPKDDNRLQLKAGARVCVQCPQSEVFGELIQSCHECQINADQWEDQRECQFEYKQYTSTSTYVQVGITKQVYHVSQAEATNGLDFYIANRCEGCKALCRSSSLICHPTTQLQQYQDPQFIDIQCSDGYYYDQFQRQCQQCPQNCAICEATPQIQTRTNIIKCNICQDGFTIYINEAESLAQPISMCIQCPQNCVKCFFGNADHNFSDDHWSSFKKSSYVYVAGNYEDSMKVYQSLYDIDLRCSSCIESPKGSFIPSLDLRICESCLNKCDICGYRTWDQTILDTQKPNLIHPTQYAQIITDTSTYQMVCLRCQGINYARTLKGDNCVQCPINSLVCYEGSISDSSIKSNTPGLKPTIVADLYIVTEMCMENYNLNEFGSCVEKTVDSLKNCKTQSSASKCQLCQDNFILQADFTCTMGCKALFPNCRSCIKKPDKIYCQDCEDGFYLNVVTNTCEVCTKISNDACKQCYQYTVDCVSRPYYPDDPCGPTIHTQDQILKLICFQCAQGVQLSQQKCLTCGTKCKDCENNTRIPYCKKCIDSNIISTTSDGGDCLDCPQYCEGCKDNSLNIYERICYKCLDGYYLDTTLKRCLKCNQSTYCKKRVVVNLNVYCDQKERQQDELILQNHLKDETQNEAFIDLLEYRKSEIEYYNQQVVSELEINLQFMADGPCVFNKITHFQINANIPSLQKLEINIRAESVVSFYVYNYIVLHGFNKISLKNIKYLSYADYEFNPHPSPQQFGLVLMDNQATEIFFENFEAYNLQGKTHYESPTYTKPNSNEAIILKKYTQFIMNLTNVYSLSMKNVQFKSMNYLDDSDQPSKSVLFKLSLNSTIIIPYFQIIIDSLLLEDVSFEDQNLFEIQNYQMSSNLQDNTKIEINDLKFTNCYFGYNSGVFAQSTTQVAGQLFINNIRLLNVGFNQSNGLIDMNTLMQANIADLYIQDVIVLNSTVLKMNTVMMNSLSVKNTQFLQQGFLFKSQLEAPWVKEIDKVFYGLQMAFAKISMIGNICSEPNCFFEIFTPANTQNIQIDLKITKISIKMTDTNSFLNKSKLNEADSALIAMKKLKSVSLLNFDSINNPKISIVNIQESGSIDVQNVQCAGKMEDHTNYCIFICDMFDPATVFVRNITFVDLTGIDNSFLAILSQMPERVLNTLENIQISDINATKCTIIQKSQIRSSIILIISEQKQQISISNVYFISNTQITDTSLFNSNPSLIAMAPYANITISNSQWQDNSGGGSVVILEADRLTIFQITIEESNSRVSNPGMKGGALNLKSSFIEIYNSFFTNSIAEEGGLMYITMKTQGELFLYNLSITNVHASSQGSQSLNGGAIYIVGLSSLQAIIHDCVFQNCYTRNSGGVFYIEPADFKLTVDISNLVINSAYALQSSFIRIMNKETSEPQMLKITYVQIIQSYSDHLMFLTMIGQLSEEEKQLFMHGNAIIQINSGSIYIDQFTYLNGTAEGFIKAHGLTNIFLTKIKIFNILLFQCPMIHLANNHFTTTKGQIDNVLALVDLYFEGLRIITQEETLKYEMYTKILKQTLIPSREGLILIEYLGIDCQVMIKDLTFNNINCSTCKNGLATFTNVQLDSKISPLFMIKQFQCKYSNTGRMGCIVVTQFDLQATSNMNQKTGISQYRLLTESIKEDVIQMFSLDFFQLQCEYGCGINIIQLSTYINSITCSGNLAKDGSCIYFYGNNLNVMQHKIIIDNFTMNDNNITDVKVTGTVLNNVTEIKVKRLFTGTFDEGPHNLGILVNDILQDIEHISKDLNVMKEEISCYLGINFNSFKNGTNLQIIFQGENFEYYKHQSGKLTLQLDEGSQSNCQLEQNEIIYDTELGGFDFNQMKIKCNKFVQFATILVSTSDIIIPTYNETSPFRVTSVLQNYILQIPLKIYRCPDGYGFAERGCYRCENDTYILNSYNDEGKQLDCKNKSAGMKETEGSIILVEKGYQRLFGDIIEKCDPLSSFHSCDKDVDCQRCKETYHEGNAGCYQGYVGPRCSDCDYQGFVYGEKYCHHENICQLCSNISSTTSSIYGLFILQSVFILMMVILQLWRTKQLANNFLKQEDNIVVENQGIQERIPLVVNNQNQQILQLMEYPNVFSVVSLVIFEIQLLSIIKLANIGLKDYYILDWIAMPALYYKYIQQTTINTDITQELLQEQIYGLQLIYGIYLICIFAFLLLLYFIKQVLKCVFPTTYQKLNKCVPNLKLMILGNILYWIILINGPSYFYYTLLANLSYEAFTQEYSLLFPSLIYTGIDIQSLLYLIIVGLILIILLLFIIFKLICTNIYFKILIKDNMANLVYKSDWKVLIPKYFYPYILVLIIAIIQEYLKSEIQRTQSIFILFIVMATLYIIYSIITAKTQKYFYFIFYEPIFFATYLVSVVCLYIYQDNSKSFIISIITFGVCLCKIIIYTFYVYWIYRQNQQQQQYFPADYIKIQFNKYRIQPNA